MYFLAFSVKYNLATMYFLAFSVKYNLFCHASLRFTDWTKMCHVPWVKTHQLPREATHVIKSGILKPTTFFICN